MNRRSFLSFLSVAPVAVSMAAQATLASSASSLRYEIAFDSCPVVGQYDQLLNAQREYQRVLALAQRGQPQAICQFGDAAARVNDAARDFYLDPHLRDTAEPQAPVSPDNQNGIPTASADDLCHFGQETETLSPNVSRRLLRAWGVNEGVAT